MSHAALVISGTRIIYNEGEKEIGIRVENVGNNPSLAQAWLAEYSTDETINDGLANQGTDNIPFFITPPAFRVNPGEAQTIRMLFSGSETLAKDRESLFSFNLLDIPPSTNENKNALHIAVSSKLKVFYRPKAIQSVAKNFEQTTKVNINANQSQFTIDNSAPFYMNFTALNIIDGNKVIKEIKLTMAAPFSINTYHLNENDIKLLQKYKNIELVYLNDYGSKKNLKIKSN